MSCKDLETIEVLSILQEFVLLSSATIMVTMITAPAAPGEPSELTIKLSFGYNDCTLAPMNFATPADLMQYILDTIKSRSRRRFDGLLPERFKIFPGDVP